MDKITLYYFLVDNKVTLARGENVKLMLEDADLDHEYVRLPRGGDWPERKAKLQAEGAHSCTMPFIETTNGQKFFKTIPILRYISAKLDNKYHGANAEENHYLDVVAEVTDVWFEKFRDSYFGSDETKVKYANEQLPQQISTFEKFYSDHTEGPYLLGEKLTYSDFLVYHLIDDNNLCEKLDNAPNLAKFVQAFEARPNIKKYLASIRDN